MRKYWKIDNINRVIHYSKAMFSWKKDDVLLASFPKSGNTWVRYFWLNYISQAEMNGEVIDFKTLDHIMPSFGLSNFFSPWEYKSLPKAAASHWRYGFYFRIPKKVLIIRDPRDVMVSYFHFINGKKDLPEIKNFSFFIRDVQYGLPAWFRYYTNWLKMADVVLRYEELKNDDIGEFEKMFDGLNLSYDKRWLTEAAKASRFERFKKIEMTFGHSKPDSNKEGFQFARKGEVGDYLNYFSEMDLLYYKDQCVKYNLNEYK